MTFRRLSTFRIFYRLSDIRNRRAYQEFPSSLTRSNPLLTLALLLVMFWPFDRGGGAYYSLPLPSPLFPPFPLPSESFTRNDKGEWLMEGGKRGKGRGLLRNAVDDYKYSTKFVRALSRAEVMTSQLTPLPSIHRFSS